MSQEGGSRGGSGAIQGLCGIPLKLYMASLSKEFTQWSSCPCASSFLVVRMLCIYLEKVLSLGHDSRAHSSLGGTTPAGHPFCSKLRIGLDSRHSVPSVGLLLDHPDWTMHCNNYVGITIEAQVSPQPCSNLFCEVYVFSEVDMLSSSAFPGLSHHHPLLCHPNWSYARGWYERHWPCSCS